MGPMLVREFPFLMKGTCVLVLIGLLVFWKPELGFTCQCTLFSLWNEGLAHLLRIKEILEERETSVYDTIPLVGNEKKHCLAKHNSIEIAVRQRSNRWPWMCSATSWLRCMIFSSNLRSLCTDKEIYPTLNPCRAGGMKRYQVKFV